MIHDFPPPVKSQKPFCRKNIYNHMKENVPILNPSLTNFCSYRASLRFSPLSSYSFAFDSLQS